MRTLLWIVLLVASGSAAAAATESQAETDQLFQAIKADRTDQLQTALNPRNIDTINPKFGGQTPLMFAVIAGSIESVKLLLERGADASKPEADGFTPLHGAGFQGRDEIAQILIDHGLDPMQPHEDGFYPMHRACWGQKARHTRTVEVFLKNGVAADIKGGDGKTCAEMTRNEATRALVGGYKEEV